MESNKYNIENFERFLREKTDEFRMYPSKRVWYSIYNNMHPGNRLPSVSMSIILIGFLFLIGFLNTTDTHRLSTSGNKQNTGGEQVAVATVTDQPNNNLVVSQPSREQPAASSSAITSNTLSVNNNTVFQRTVAVEGTQSTRTRRLSTATQQPARASILISGGEAADIVEINELQRVSNNPVSSVADKINNGPDQSLAISNNNLGGGPYVINGTETITVSENALKQEEPNPVSISPANNNSGENAVVTAIVPGSEDNTNTKTTGEPAAKNNTATTTTTAATTQSTGLTPNDKAWIEDFAMYNKPAAKKWAGKVSLQGYITPSVVYRKLRNNAADKVLSGTTGNFNNFNADDVVKQKPSFGIETGVSLLYDLSRKIRLKAGAQFNYTRYNAHAFETNHPIATTITMNDEDGVATYEAFRSSNYSNIADLYTSKLHNETYQVSIPLGADFKMASLTENLSWYVGATIQPTLVLHGKSYIISTDRRSYIYDPSLLNRFNMNAGFETFFSYKTCGYTLQFGPQYRSQLFTTNTKLYSIEERLQNFGFKFGITKRL